MNIKIVTADEMKINSWSGGKTTEMFIYPPEASYNRRNFKFRVSSATVDSDFSVFTPLNGVKRYLTVLDGKITLDSDGKSTSLSPYETICFSGDARTVSRGKCVDFNLMLKNCEGYMATCVCCKEMQAHVDRNSYTMLYCTEAALEISWSGNEYSLPAGNLFIIECSDSESTLSVKSGEAARIIRSVAYKN